MGCGPGGYFTRFVILPWLEPDLPQHFGGTHWALSTQSTSGTPSVASPQARCHNPELRKPQHPLLARGSYAFLKVVFSLSGPLSRCSGLTLPPTSPSSNQHVHVRGSWADWGHCLALEAAAPPPLCRIVSPLSFLTTGKGASKLLSANSGGGSSPGASSDHRNLLRPLPSEHSPLVAATSTSH